MKKNNLIYLIFIILNVAFSNAQTGYTVLTEDIYETIKFEDVLFTDIKATQGDINQMANLFPIDENPGPQQIGSGSNDPNSVTIEEYGQEIDEFHREFLYDNRLKVTFYDVDFDNELEVVDLKSNTITIDGITLNIGDPISNLTSINYTIKTGSNSNKLVLLIKNNNYGVSMSLRLDSNNNLTEIHYYENP